jgi:hypothetical protein
MPKNGIFQNILSVCSPKTFFEKIDLKKKKSTFLQTSSKLVSIFAELIFKIPTSFNNWWNKTNPR